MKIEFDQDTGDVTADPETIARLTQGTPFQRSMNLIAMLDALMSETDAEVTKGMNRHQRRAFAAKMRKHRKADLLKNTPPMADFDPAAIAAFYD